MFCNHLDRIIVPAPRNIEEGQAPNVFVLIGCLVYCIPELPFCAGIVACCVELQGLPIVPFSVLAEFPGHLKRALEHLRHETWSPRFRRRLLRASCSHIVCLDGHEQDDPNYWGAASLSPA